MTGRIDSNGQRRTLNILHLLMTKQKSAERRRNRYWCQQYNKTLKLYKSNFYSRLWLHLLQRLKTVIQNWYQFCNRFLQTVYSFTNSSKNLLYDTIFIEIFNLFFDVIIIIIAIIIITVFITIISAYSPSSVF